MSSQNSLRTLFLQEFTKNIILNSKKGGEIFPYHPLKQLISFQPAQRQIAAEISPVHNTAFRKMPPIPNFQQKYNPMVKQVVNPAIASITPSPQPLPKEFSLGKIDALINDRTLIAIECPGPGKLIIVKTLGKAAATQITLSEQEIKSIVETFSKSAKIPLINGMFKAAVGNLVITAVMSDLVGSRFIINKYTPYSVLENIA